MQLQGGPLHTADKEMSAVGHRVLKIVVLGAEKVGKSALIEKYINLVFTESYKSSVGNNGTKIVQIDGKKCTLEITATVLENEQKVCETGDAFILLYAIDNTQSLQYLRQLHRSLKRAKSPSDLSRYPVFLVGSKADLENNRSVSLEQARQLALELRCQKLFEISSKDHEGEINDMFEKLAREALRVDRSSTQPPLSPISCDITTDVDSQLGSESPQRGSVLSRLKFGSLRRKSSMQSLTRKKSGSFGESVLSMASGNVARGTIRSISYGQPAAAPARPLQSSPFRLDVDTSSWREKVKWPTHLIPEEDMKVN